MIHQMNLVIHELKEVIASARELSLWHEHKCEICRRYIRSTDSYFSQDTMLCQFCVNRVNHSLSINNERWTSTFIQFALGRIVEFES